MKHGGIEDNSEDHECRFGPFESARFTGEAVRRCVEPGCKIVSLDCEEEEESEAQFEYGENDLSCDQCNACMIQGVYCHETGCPNSKKVAVKRGRKYVSL